MHACIRSLGASYCVCVRVLVCAIETKQTHLILYILRSRNEMECIQREFERQHHLRYRHHRHWNHLSMACVYVRAIVWIQWAAAH